MLIIQFFSCSEREWLNPFDPDVLSSDWAPTDLTVSVNANSVFLEWKNNAVIDVHYKIQRRINDGIDEFSVIDSVENIGYVDIPPINTAGYSYQIRAYIDDKMSGPGNTVTVDFIPAGTEIWTNQLTAGVNAAALSIDRRYLVIVEEHTVITAGNYSTKIHLVDTQSGDIIWTVTDEGYSSAAIDISPDNTKLALAHFSGMVKVRDLVNGALLWESVHSDDKQCRQILFSPDNSITFSGGADSTVKAWNTANGQLLWEKTHEQSISALDISRDNSILIAGDYASRVTAYAPSSGALLWSASVSNGVKDLQISPNGLKIAVGVISGDLFLLNAGDGSESWSASFSGGMTFDLEFDHDGTNLLSGANYHVKMWQVENGQFVWEMPFSSFVHHVELSPDNSHAMTVGQLAEVNILDIDTGQRTLEIPCENWVFFGGFSENSQAVVFVDGQQIRCNWAVNSWEVNQ